jgi:hypothetical protein
MPRAERDPFPRVGEVASAGKETNMVAKAVLKVKALLEGEAKKEMKV